MDNSANSNPQDVSPFEALRRMREQTDNPQPSQNTQNMSSQVSPEKQNLSGQVAPNDQVNSQNVNENRAPQDRNQNSNKKRDQAVQSKNSNSHDQSSGSESDGVLLISRFQMVLYAASLIILPSVIIPLPWVWSDFAKGIILLIFATLIVTLEIIKMFVSGKLSVVKSFLDLAVLFILLSFLISTVFSQDRGISMFGFENRLGVGVIVIGTLILYFYILRSFMKTRKGLGWILFFTTIGISFSAFLSILSFFGVNLLGLFSSAENLFVVGLPVTQSAITGIVFWGAGLLLGSLYILFAKGKTGVQMGVVFALLLINILAIGLFSINQGLYTAVLVVLSMLTLMVVMVLSRQIFDNTKMTLVTILAILVGVTFIVFKIPAVGDKVSESTNAITQISLPGDVTWSIVTRTLSESVKTGVVGLGVDTFSVYYNAYKPAFIDNTDITQTNYVYGFNEILTLTGNRGLIGALIWLAVGVMFVYQLFRDFSGKYTKSKEEAVFIQLADIVLLFIYIASFLTYFTFELYFVFFMILAVRILIGAVLNPKDAESFVIKLDILVERVSQGGNSYILLGLSVITAIIGLLLLSMNVTSLTAGLQAMGIENSIIQTQIEINEADKDRGPGEPSNFSFEKREEALVKMIDDYANVIELEPENSVYRRRRTILLNEYVTLLANQLQEDATAKQEGGATQEDLQNDEEILTMQNNLNQVIELAVNEAEKTTEYGSNIFANWDTRSLLYSGLVGLGLTNYTDSGLEATDRAIRFNPVCYTCFYRAAELFIVDENIEGAGNAVSAALNINPNHIPSLVLGSEIAIASENYETAQALLNRVLEILDAIGAQEDPLYSSIEARLEQLEEALGSGGSLNEQLDPNQLPDEDILDDEFDDEADLPVGPIDEDLVPDTDNTEEEQTEEDLGLTPDELLPDLDLE